MAHLSALLPHAPGIHPLHTYAESSLDNLSLLLLLGVLEVTLVAKVHEVARLVHLALEAAESRFDRLSLPDLHLNVDVKGRGGGRDGCDFVLCRKICQVEFNHGAMNSHSHAWEPTLTARDSSSIFITSLCYL